MTSKKIVLPVGKTAIKNKPVKKSFVKQNTAHSTQVLRLISNAIPGVKSEKKQGRGNKEHKKKVVRDSFTMPYNEYQKIADIKAICMKSKMHVKKSEILRAGLKWLATLSATQLKLELNSLEKIKTGRPKKH